MHPRYRAGFLIYSYYCLLYALLLCSASLARKFRAAAVLAFSALRILSFEVLRVRERASTHPTHCLRTFRSTVRPTCKKEREVRTNTYVRGRDKRSLNATPSTKSKKVSVCETGLARPYNLMLSTCCTRLLDSRSRLVQLIERHTTCVKHKTTRTSPTCLFVWSCFCARSLHASWSGL